MNILQLVNWDVIPIVANYDTTASLSVVDVKTILIHYGMMGVNQFQTKGGAEIVPND